MTTRKAPDLAAIDAKEPPSKRRRFADEISAACLDSLNSDCLLLVLSYLSFEDLNSVAICGRRYRKVRAHETLDQTRTGTIVLSEGCTIESLVDPIVENGRDEIFQGNQTHLKLDGVERLAYGSCTSSERAKQRILSTAGAQLTGVTCLVMTFGGSGYNNVGLNHYIPLFFPHLVNVDMSALDRYQASWLCSEFVEKCSSLSKLSLNKCTSIHFRLNGVFYDKQKHMFPFVDIQLDDCTFSLRDRGERRQFSSSRTSDCTCLWSAWVL